MFMNMYCNVPSENNIKICDNDIKLILSYIYYCFFIYLLNEHQFFFYLVYVFLLMAKKKKNCFTLPDTSSHWSKLVTIH